MNKNLSINMGNCNHRAILPPLVEKVRNGSVHPLSVLSKREPMTHVLAAYKAFHLREPGWIKVALSG